LFFNFKLQPYEQNKKIETMKVKEQKLLQGFFEGLVSAEGYALHTQDKVTNIVVFVLFSLCCEQKSKEKKTKKDYKLDLFV